MSRPSFQFATVQSQIMLRTTENCLNYYRQFSSHRRHGQDTTVLSRPSRRCELGIRDCNRSVYLMRVQMSAQTAKYVITVIITAEDIHARQDKTRQDNGEKRMQAQVPIYPYPCNILN